LQKALTIGLAIAAIAAGALSLVKVDHDKPGATYVSADVVSDAAAAESDAAPVVIRMAQLAASQPYVYNYERGPRIIHVPQPGERADGRGNDRVASRPAARASVERQPEPAVADEEDDADDDVAPAPPARPRNVTPKPRAANAPPQPPAAITPRWKLRTDAPPPAPPPGPRRAVLSAPPPGFDGPTPLRPTPRFDGKGEAAEKFAAPSEPAPAPTPRVSETEPPLGYTPPTTPEPPLGYSPPATPEPPLEYAPAPEN